MTSEPVEPSSVALTVTTPATSLVSVPAQMLEDRVQRLEEAVAALAQNHEWPDEPRSLATKSVHAAMPALKHEVAPRAIPIPPPPTASLADFALPPLQQAPVARPLTQLLRPFQAALPATTSVASRLLSPSSLWRDLWWDMRTGWRMLRDPAYPMTTACRVFPLFAIFYVTIWPLLSAWSGILGSVMNYFVNAIVIYIAFKIVQRELRRYYDFTEKYRR